MSLEQSEVIEQLQTIVEDINDQFGPKWKNIRPELRQHLAGEITQYVAMKYNVAPAEIRIVGQEMTLVLH